MVISTIRVRIGTTKPEPCFWPLPKNAKLSSSQITTSSNTCCFRVASAVACGGGGSSFSLMSSSPAARSAISFMMSAITPSSIGLALTR